jgi:hypothetical protein
VSASLQSGQKEKPNDEVIHSRIESGIHLVDSRVSDPASTETGQAANSLLAREASETDWASEEPYRFFSHLPNSPNPRSSSSQSSRCRSVNPSMLPMSVDFTGPMPQNRSVLRIRLLRL